MHMFNGKGEISSREAWCLKMLEISNLQSVVLAYEIMIRNNNTKKYIFTHFLVFMDESKARQEDDKNLILLPYT